MKYERLGTKMSSHKTPYEIRLNILELAQKIESERAQAESMHSQMDIPSAERVITRAPSVKDILATATELNNFVSTENKN